jgi:methenyltetrahydromethanopterin cyclohydrolase
MTTALDSSNWPSVNRLTNPLVSQLLEQAQSLRLGIERAENGATIIDAGVKHAGGLEAGRLIAEICMGGLGHVSLHTANTFAHWPWMLSVHSNNPILACLGSQYAGWSLAHEKFFSLGSGPSRAIAGREADAACLVLESEKAPPLAVIEKVARDTGLPADKLTFILTPTRSLAGTVQIVARVLEVAMHKIHTLHFPLEHVVDGMASAPVPPPAPDFLIGMGRTNDAILFGGHAHIFVKGSDEAAAKLAQELPSSASRDYGRPFAEVFKSVNMDFYKIDPMLFSPAAVTVTAVESGNTFTGGKLDAALIDLSFGYKA